MIKSTWEIFFNLKRAFKKITPSDKMIFADMNFILLRNSSFRIKVKQFNTPTNVVLWCQHLDLS